MAEFVKNGTEPQSFDLMSIFYEHSVKPLDEQQSDDSFFRACFESFYGHCMTRDPVVPVESFLLT